TATYDDNVRHLLERMQGVTNRSARFRTVVVMRRTDGSEIVAEGCVEGTIAQRPQGEGGFGYDPVFLPDEAQGRSFAEMTGADKHAISHRGRALRAMASQLAEADYQ
ncbi:MAG: non-canonical purine NTP pyrophosphatase, partial [Acidimicrobiales bacterium]